MTAAAWRFYKAGAAMIAFLNGEHPELGGRPLDLAVNSDKGLAAVLTMLQPAVGATAPRALPPVGEG